MIPEFKCFTEYGVYMCIQFHRAIGTVAIIYSIDFFILRIANGTEIQNIIFILLNTNIWCSVMGIFLIHAPLIYGEIKSGSLKGFENIICLLNEQKLN